MRAHIDSTVLAIFIMEYFLQKKTLTLFIYLSFTFFHYSDTEARLERIKTHLVQGLATLHQNG